MRALPLLAVVPLLLAACAPMEGSGPADRAERVARPCFLTQQAVSFRSDGRQAIYVRTIGDDVFRLGATGCLELDSTFRVGIEPGAGAGSSLCEGDPVRLVVQGFDSQARTCPARVEARLTEAEVAALPSRQRP